MGNKILVTGADGFIGSHLVESLLNDGHKVKALSYYNSFNSLGWLEGLRHHKHLEIISGDIRDVHFCQNLAKDVDVIYHLASLIAIPYSYAAPQSYIDTNVSGTLNIAQAAKDNKVKRLIHLSTSEVYGTAQYVPIDEKHALQPQSPYSASKIGADAIAMSFYHSFDLPVTIARPFNSYGPRQSARAVIPTIITQVLDGKDEIKLGMLDSTRDFTYVSDTCNGLKLLANCDKAVGKVVNIGSGAEISIKNLVELIAEIMGKNIRIATDKARLRPESSEVYRLLCDNTALKQLTGFDPQHDLRAGLEKTIEWLSKPENKQRYKADVYNV